MTRTNGIVAMATGALIIVVPLTRAGDEAQKGAWGTEFYVGNDADNAIKAIHMILLPTEKVLCLDQHRDVTNRPNDAALINPTGPSITFPTQMPRDFFCSGHAHLPDGMVLVATGGNEILFRHDQASLFDPWGDLPGHQWWTSVDSLPAPGGNRYYPTATTLGNGKVLVTAGREATDNDIPADEDFPCLFTPGAPAGQQWVRFDGLQGSKVVHWYPFMFQLAEGKLFMGGSAYFNDEPGRDPAIHLDSYKLNVAIQGWESPAVSRAARPGMSAVMYRPDIIMKAGYRIGTTSSDVQVIDLTQPSPSWTNFASLNLARFNFYLIPLPDGRVIAAGGSVSAEVGPLEAEWVDPSDQSPSWSLLAPMATKRMYHSSAVLLPDARVLIGGGEEGLEYHHRTAQIFKPPYLFKSSSEEITTDRPTITSAPDEVTYNMGFTVVTPDAADIVQVSLIRLGAATHSFDQSTHTSRWTSQSPWRVGRSGSRLRPSPTSPRRGITCCSS